MRDVRRVASVGGRAGVSLVLIGWILGRSNLHGVWDALSSADPFPLLFAWGLLALGYLLRITRWRYLLRALEVRASLGYLFRSFMVGVFFNQLLPSTIGGDTVRGYDSWRAGTSKPGAVAVIFVDRFLGLFALVGFAVAAVFVADTELAGRLGRFPTIVAGLAILMLLVAWVAFLSPASLLPRSGVKRLLPGPRLRRWLKGGKEAFAMFRREKRILLGGLLVSICVQGLVIAFHMTIARSLGLAIPAREFFLIIPVATLVMMLPISINAIGIRENVYAFLFGFYGLGEEQALAFAWLVLGIVLLNAVLGGLFFLARRRAGEGVTA
ncbi:MAG: YbhN family protein [Gemmatimonadota bacterium]